MIVQSGEKYLRIAREGRRNPYAQCHNYSPRPAEIFSRQEIESEANLFCEFLSACPLGSLYQNIHFIVMKSWPSGPIAPLPGTAPILLAACWEHFGRNGKAGLLMRNCRPSKDQYLPDKARRAHSRSCLALLVITGLPFISECLIECCLYIEMLMSLSYFARACRTHGTHLLNPMPRAWK